MSSPARFAEFGSFKLFPAERRLVLKDQEMALGSRALDILVVLVERAGTVVTKQEIMAKVWTGLSVDESSLRVHIASLRKVLKTEGRTAPYIVNSAGRGYSFAGHVTWHDPQPASLPARPVSLQRITALPRLPTRILGRDEDVIEISGLLAEHRFVTIHGAGGIGKTTVALRVAHDLLSTFNDGVLFLDLGLRGPQDDLAQIVASSLGVMADSGDPIGSVLDFLRQRQVLLVLDCCEHLADPAARLAEAIVHETPRTRVLVTSREILRAEGEHVYGLAPLAAPPSDRSTVRAQLSDYPASQLFLERVVAGGHRAPLTDGDAEAVASICRKVDGIALALELVAGRVSSHGFQETAALLDSRLTLLWQGRRTAVPRHQTLHATLDWSHGLLPEAERKLLRRLSVFVGLFSLEAAQAVAADETLDASEVAAGLAQLAGKSLVAVDTTDVTAKYRLLDITRAYAQSKLAASADAHAVARRHAAHYADLLRHFVVHNHRIGEYGPEHLANIRAGLEWSFGPTGDPDLAVRLTNAATRIFREFCLLGECRHWCDRALSILDTPLRGTFWEMNLHSSLAYCLMFTARNDEPARLAFERGLQLSATIRDPFFQFRLLANLHMYHRRRGEIGKLLDLAREAEALAPALQEPTAIVAAHVMLGVSHHLGGNLAAARTALEASRELRPDPYRFTTNYLGFHQDGGLVLARTLWLQGHPDQALALLREEEAVERRDPVTACLLLIWAATVLLWTGNRKKAEAYVADLVQLAGENSLIPYRTLGLGLTGELMVRRGETREGLRLLREAGMGLRACGYELFLPALSCAMAEGLTSLGQLDLALAQLDETFSSSAPARLYNGPELLRVRGEVLLKAGNERAAERAFRESLDLAERQGALSWRLRTATSLARLSKLADARAILRATLARFDQGFETADLAAARRLLSDGTPHHPPPGNGTRARRSNARNSSRPRS